MAHCVPSIDRKCALYWRHIVWIIPRGLPLYIHLSMVLTHTNTKYMNTSKHTPTTKTQAVG